MTMAYTVNAQEGHAGSLRVVTGTYTNGSGETGGDIVTGLTVVYAAFLQPTKSAVVASQHVINETFPLNSGTITIVTNDNDDGVWMAVGY